MATDWATAFFTALGLALGGVGATLGWELVKRQIERGARWDRQRANAYIRLAAVYAECVMAEPDELGRTARSSRLRTKPCRLPHRPPRRRLWMAPGPLADVQTRDVGPLCCILAPR